MLDKTRLKNNLKAAYIEASAIEGTENDVLEVFCEKLAGVLVDEIKQVKINYTNGLTAPNGVVGGALNHTVS
jgi:hypothetical protein